jgi:uncharacterized protein
MNKRTTILAGVAAAALLAAGIAWQMGLFTKVSDIGNCVDVVAQIGVDAAHAVAVCRRQANEGDAIAQTDLGKMYAEGRGVAQDLNEAKHWFQLAADQGQPDGQYNLGVMYAVGEGVPQDFVQAVKWYSLAAERGQTDAQNSLGMRYKRGEGVAQDYVQAHKWFALSAANATHPTDRARAIANLDAIVKLMSPAQIAEAERLAHAWNPVAP